LLISPTMSDRTRTIRTARNLLLGIAPVVAIVGTPLAAAPIEITPFVGYVTNDYEAERDLVCPAIFAGCRLEAETEDGAAFGFILGIELAPSWQLEVLAGRLDGDITATARARSLNPGIPDVEASEEGEFEAAHLQVGAARTFGTGRLRPFVGAAAGGSRVEVGIGGFFPDSEEAFSASLGAGVKADVLEHLGLRVEARAWWVDLAPEAGGAFIQLDLHLGAVVRW
jgi:hypothetical protein